MRLVDYWQLAKVSWSNGFVYRLNFVMWRVRVVVQLLAVYFLWVAVLGNNQSIFGYRQTEMLTYILVTATIRSLVFSSRSIDTQEEISSGDLNNYLVKPVNYFHYWLTRDLADKLLNILFAIGELVLFVVLLKPPILLPGSIGLGVVFLGVSFLAMMMFFYFSFLVSLTTFWWPEQNGWPQRFLVFMVLEFLAGGFFPLDILPQQIYSVIKFLPTSFFLYFPLQVYLGKIEGMSLLVEIGVMLVWLVGLKKLAELMFNRGLKIYGAYGR